MRGHLFADPVTGLTTFHPPVYHLFLASLRNLGLSFDFILFLVVIVYASLFIALTYKIIDLLFGRQVALYCCLLLPFTFDYMGSRSILLATAFNFSLPFYLAGLWYYLQPPENNRWSLAAGFFWGLAFLISPVYVFLLGLTFLYELVIAGRYRRFALLAGTFVAVIIPFIIQAVAVYSGGRGSASTFALWRGLPGNTWLVEFGSGFLSPYVTDLKSIGTGIHVIVLVLATAAIISKRRVFWYIPVAALAYVMTCYHFSGQYGMRIMTFLSIFLVAIAIEFLIAKEINRLILIGCVLAVAAYGAVNQYRGLTVWYTNEKDLVQVNDNLRYLRAGLMNYVAPDEYIFCSKDVYRYYIIGNFPLHALGMYRTMDYYQVPAAVSDELERDYDKALAIMDDQALEALAKKYNINAAICTANELQKKIPLFQTISRYWTKVYDPGGFFYLYRRPQAPHP